MTIVAFGPMGGPLDDFAPFLAILGLIYGARVILGIVRCVNRRDDPRNLNGKPRTAVCDARARARPPSLRFRLGRLLRPLLTRGWPVRPVEGGRVAERQEADIFRVPHDSVPAFADRRRFLARVATALSAPLTCVAAPGRQTRAAAVEKQPGETADSVVSVEVADGHELQSILIRHAKSRRTIRIGQAAVVKCGVREDMVDDEKSIHALLVPEGTRLDLNGATLELDLRSNSYGVRLSNDSAICNGTIRVVHSAGKGSQACWHSAISVGAAYGDGGTPARPGWFSKVSRWSIENMTIDQQVAASAIQIMSEACHGSIRNVRILDSDNALLGIGLDWGSVGPITSADQEIPRMRRLWERGEIYSTHPHDIVIENIRVGKLLRNVDANDAGIRCSACHRITIRNVEVETAATAVAIFGGDLGYEFAPADQRDLEHSGYTIENVRIAKALRFGLVLNGLADNVWRSRKSHGYDAVRDPAHPGLNKPVIRNVALRGNSAPASQGIYSVALTEAELDDIDISGFEIGVHVEDWVRGMRFRQSRIEGNKQNTRIEGTTEPAIGVVFDPPVEK
jgi:hypothetical protein